MSRNRHAPAPTTILYDAPKAQSCDYFRATEPLGNFVAAALATPFHLRNAGPVIDNAGKDEEQIGETIQIDHDCLANVFVP
jgi:hypothetical protein